MSNWLSKMRISSSARGDPAESLPAALPPEAISRACDAKPDSFSPTKGDASALCAISAHLRPCASNSDRLPPAAAWRGVASAWPGAWLSSKLVLAPSQDRPRRCPSRRSVCDRLANPGESRDDLLMTRSRRTEGLRARDLHPQARHRPELHEKKHLRRLGYLRRCGSSLFCDLT